MQTDAICIFLAPIDPLTVRVSIADTPKLINTIVGKSSWTLLSIQLPQTATETKEDRENPEASL